MRSDVCKKRHVVTHSFNGSLAQLFI